MYGGGIRNGSQIAILTYSTCVCENRERVYMHIRMYSLYVRMYVRTYVQ